MLVLSRKTRETVVLGGAGSFGRVCKVTVLKIAGEKVTLGFEVDAEIPVQCLEVWERLRARGELADCESRAEPIAVPCG